MKPLSLTLAAACLALSACSTLPPTEAQLSKVPVVNFGQPLPAGDNYILHFPAGTPLPVRTLVDGNLFAQTGASTATVELKHDIYAYRHFVSLDGKHWVPGRELLDSRVTIDIPGRDGKTAGLLHLQMNTR